MLRPDEVVHLKAVFVGAAYGKVNRDLVRCTAEVRSSTLHMQFVVKRGASEESMDDIYDIFGDILGSLPELIGDSEIVEISGEEELRRTEPLPIILFRVADRELQLLEA